MRFSRMAQFFPPGFFGRLGVTLILGCSLTGPPPAPAAEAPGIPPLDPQQVQDQQDMTWRDYHPLPDQKNWADPALKPQRPFRIALVAVDFPDQPFVITQPRHSDPFGNPQIRPVPREKVAQFYADFFNRPGTVNHGQTINGYWMEQSRGRFGIPELRPFGPYRLPKKLWEYGLNEWGQREATPNGKPAGGRLEADTDALWKAAAGDLKSQFDAVLRLYAGYDETGVWQEFGEMKFQTRDDIPAAWGNPNPALPRWVVTRYVPWTSWRAGAMQWGLSTIRQGENSGTITHELGHFAFSIGDNNNNPYVQPYRRAGSGPWDMMDRGSFNGPGGPHRRWVVPPTEGAAMPAGLMLRNKLVNHFLPDEQVLRLSRDGLAESGLVIARVTAREVEPLPGSFAGVVVRLDGDLPHDRTPSEDPALNPYSPGRSNYDYYTLEVVQRVGYDSFCPDNGVLLAKNKDRESGNGGTNGFNCFTWVIDAHPEDRHLLDFRRPHGEPVFRTPADYRQLNDALFHAGLNSGSQFEWADAPNGLHFYVIDLHRDARGVRDYTLGIRSLDGIGPQIRAVRLTPPARATTAGDTSRLDFQLANPGSPAPTAPGLHPQNANGQLGQDLYRLSIVAVAPGWRAELANALAAVPFGETSTVPVYLRPLPGTPPRTPPNVTLKVVSEGDPRVQTLASFTAP